MRGRPISSYRQTVNKRGERGPRVCLLQNECLTCDGTCAGYDQTAERMAPLREDYRRKKAKLRGATGSALNVSRT